MSTAEPQRDEIHADKARKTKENSIIISALKTHVPPIIGGMGEGKEFATPLTEIRNHEWWNSHDGVR